MPTNAANLLMGNRFEVEVVPANARPGDVAAQVLALSFVSPLRSVSTLEFPDKVKTVTTRQNYYDSIELKRALVDDTYLFDWRQNWHTGTKDYRDVYIRPLAENDIHPEWQWKLSKCWPHLWEGPEFDAMQSNILFERLELYYSELEWMSV